MYRITKELSNPIFFFSIFYFVLFGLFKLSLSFVLRFFVYSYHSRVITSVAVIYSLSFLRNPIERKNCNLLYNFPFPPLFPFFSFFILLFFFFFFYISVCISLLQAIIHPLSRLWLCMTDIFHFALVCINLLLYDVQREQIDHLSDRSPRAREQNDNTRRLISSLLPLSPSSFLFLPSFLRCVKLK